MNGKAHPQFSDAEFIRSSSCTYPPGGCVEVAIKDGVVAVRDGQNPERVLIFGTADWQTFIQGAKRGEFDAK